MVVGFNHNFQYKSVTYHIQTEDGGLGSPNIITLLYHGGTILASRKTSYADITKADQLEKVVEDLMKEQHKGMLRSLKNGEFDDVIARYQARTGKKAAPAEAPAPKAAVPETPVDPAKVETEPVEATRSPRETAVLAPKQAAPQPKQAAPQPKQAAPQPKPVAKSPSVAASLDEIVLSYLMGDEK